MCVCHLIIKDYLLTYVIVCVQCACSNVRQWQAPAVAVDVPTLSITVAGTSLVTVAVHSTSALVRRGCPQTTSAPIRLCFLYVAQSSTIRRDDFVMHSNTHK